MTGVNAGISCVLKRLRGGKEDVQSSMAAAFGSGAVFTLVSSSGTGMAPPNLAANALSSGLLFALMQGGLFKLGEKFSKPPTKEEDVLYTKTRGMLTSLGLHNYEKNFKSGFLTDTTLPLLTDSALRDVKIPPGPRLLIIDHIQREAELNNGKGARRTFLENAHNMFSIQIHHGGIFHKYPSRRYVDGHVDIFDMVGIELFNVIALNKMVSQLGYIGESEPLFYNYLRPLSSLDEGLYPLACDDEVCCLATLVRSFKLLKVYREHGFTIVNS
ncbi:mitochondrial import inner membrane translocase subunit TIM22-like protein [Tanacetum coccineum]|uniref:Mitochondrial import inner membrane translocase subunit TIM22-like protein n=1 Tax=Tanacetum coccineum TaxID=301880 RepID=A0ABQ5CWD0_9ASTR